MSQTNLTIPEPISIPVQSDTDTQSLSPSSSDSALHINSAAERNSQWSRNQCQMTLDDSENNKRTTKCIFIGKVLAVPRNLRGSRALSLCFCTRSPIGNRCVMSDYHSRGHTKLIVNYLNKPPYKFGIKIWLLADMNN